MKFHFAQQNNTLIREYLESEGSTTYRQFHRCFVLHNLLFSGDAMCLKTEINSNKKKNCPFANVNGIASLKIIIKNSFVLSVSKELI